MEDNRHFIVQLIESVGLWVVMGIFAGGFFLMRGINSRNPIAYVILGGIVFVIVAGVGAGFVLGVQQISESREAARERRAQAHFRDNATENLAIMQQMAGAQAAQARMLAAHQTALQRSLPVPGNDTVDADFVAFNPALLDSLELEE